MSAIRLLVGLVFCGILALQGWTQYLAYHWGYHALLGTPLWQGRFFAQRHSVYWWWKALVWQWQWGSVAMKSAIGIGLLLAFSLGWLALHRTRSTPPAMTGHGTARWATQRDMKKAGLR